MEMRRRAQPTTPWERAKFVLLWSHGMSLRTIARHTGSSVTTVYRLDAHVDIPRFTIMPLQVAETLMAVNPPRGFGLFTAVKGQESNKTQQDWMSVVTVQARQMRMVSWCAMVILVTDNPIVLGTFAELSMKNQLLVSSTKLLAITQLPIRRLESIDYFHKVFSRMDAMILTFDDSSTVTSGLFIYLPNITPARGKIQLATLSSMGLTWVSDLPIFPDKYTKFLERPVMKIAREQISQTQDEGCNQPFIAYLSKAMNFTCNMVYAAGNVYGTRNVDGTWSGMIGMLIREEADISAASFAYTPLRGQVVDYSIPFLVQYSTIVVAEREKAGGIKLQLLHEFWRSMDTLLQRGDHVLVAVEIISRMLISRDFTKRGQCDFYTAKERILPVFLSVAGQKGSPIVPQLNRRLSRGPSIVNAMERNCCCPAGFLQ
ncbi:hypothetical protein O3P69_003172 [Scylla paramamosain]|uniref:Ionotropic glutamate receptor L-glutamate and glycine-binding domain-containing protein n=1 Tax=Scylla paramamosain TaxID=85552 RepID=A0AAW0UM59_SCYPA